VLGLGATVEDLVDSRDDLPYVASLVTLRLEVLQTFVAGKVNLAARTVKLADPGSVLVSAGVRNATNDYAFTPVGAQRLKGFDEPIELFRLERAPHA
jgi:class 3 adenylate cyclase